MTPTKVCSQCNRELPVTEFHRRRVNVKSGVRAACKECTNAQKRIDRARKRELTDEEKHKEMVRARTRRAIAKGSLVPKPCEVCGDEEVEAHHPDYDCVDAHLVVQWLCKHHHASLHGKSAWTKQLDWLSDSGIK